MTTLKSGFVVCYHRYWYLKGMGTTTDRDRADVHPTEQAAASSVLRAAKAMGLGSIAAGKVIRNEA